MKNNNLSVNYNEYKMKLSEYVFWALIGTVAMAFLGILFFRSAVFTLLLCIPGFFYPILKKKNMIKKRKQKLLMQFREFLSSFSSSLMAGRSPESAVRASFEEINAMYLWSGEISFMAQEIAIITRKLDMNMTLEDCFFDFAQRSGLCDIQNFADVFSVARAAGGNLCDVVKNSYSVIGQKIDVKNEMEIKVTEQKFGQKILTAVSVGIVLIISLTSADYINPLYEGSGRIIMLIVLLLIAGSWYLGHKILDIEV